MLVDTHCHLYMSPLGENVEGAIARAKGNGVEKIIVPAINAETAHSARVLAERFEEVHFAVGIHPLEIEPDYTSDSAERCIRTFYPHPKLVGIGEIGLDFRHRRNASDKNSCSALEERQAEVFASQVRVACELNLPIIVHNVDAGREIIEVLESFPEARGVFHCFDGAKRTINFLRKREFYASFAGNITYKNARSVRLAIRKTPEERILVETDAPFITPEPMRGNFNEPAYLHLTLEKVAEALEKSAKEVKILTSRNAYYLFGLGTFIFP